MVQGGVQDSAFLTSGQERLMLLVSGPHCEYIGISKPPEASVKLS